MFIVGSGLFFWWVRSFQDKIESFKKDEFMEEMKIPELQEQLEENLPGDEIKE